MKLQKKMNVLNIRCQQVKGGLILISFFFSTSAKERIPFEIGSTLRLVRQAHHRQAQCRQAHYRLGLIGFVLGLFCSSLKVVIFS
jgi:hypothetical protein